MTARVFVPLVGADGAGQQLFEALAGSSPPEAHPANLVPQISDLHDFGLYRVGQTVREAVTRFCDDRRARVWLGRRNARLDPWYLRISDLQVGRLSDENARSAGLGLAVAALLQSFQKDKPVVFATGEVLLSQTPGEAGVRVGAVGGIRGKLGLIGDYIGAHRTALAGRTVFVLVPTEATDGRPLMEAEGRTISRLRQAAADAGVALTVAAIPDLDALDGLFGAFSAETMLTRRATVAVLSALGLFTALAGGWLYLTSAPVHLAWLTMDGQQTAGAEPRRAHYVAATDKLEMLPPCYDRQRQPVVVGGETLLLRVAATEDRPYASALAPPQFFIASVSRSADPVVLDASLFRTAGENVVPGALTDAVAAIPVEATDDEIRLFVVATRDRTVNLSSLTEDLRSRLDGLEGAAVLATTSQFLKDHFDGQIDYQFKVTTDATLCP